MDGVATLARITIVTATVVGLLPAVAPAAIFTVAGSDRDGRDRAGMAGTAATIRGFASIAAQADGSVLIADRGRVRRLDPTGRLWPFAGTGRPGFSGDGSAAIHASVRPSDLAVMPDGAVLVAECANHRVRRIRSDGLIETVAGSGPVTGDGAFAGDGGPAVGARLDCPVGVAARADGSFVIADRRDNRVRAVSPDGTITTLAGTGANANREGPVEGTAARMPVTPSAVATLPDGGTLIADAWAHRLWRVTLDGRITSLAGNGSPRGPRTDGQLGTLAPLNPQALAVRPDGRIVVVDTDDTLLGERPLVRVVNTDGTVDTVAGTAAWVPWPPTGFERLGDGGPARNADLLHISDIALADDGGLLLTEHVELFDFGASRGRVRYVAPSAPTRLAVAFRRGRDRIFQPGAAVSLRVTLSSAARVDLRIVIGRREVRRLRPALPEGTTEVPLGPLAARPHTISATATDQSGRMATDRIRIAPAGWLHSTLADYVAEHIAPTAIAFQWWEVPGHMPCARRSATRFDCVLSQQPRLGRCARVAAIQLRSRRLSWGTYACPPRSQPRWIRRPRVLRASEFAECAVGTDDCRFDVLGRVPDQVLALSDRSAR